MFNWLKPRLDNIIIILEKDLDLISKKRKDDEWKRDHYRYTFTVAAQRMYELLNLELSGRQMLPIKDSTKKELKILRNMIDTMINK